MRGLSAFNLAILPRRPRQPCSSIYYITNALRCSFPIVQSSSNIACTHHLAPLDPGRPDQTSSFRLQAKTMEGSICDTNGERKAEIEAVKSWMATCVSQHDTSGCNTRRSNTLPGRLIEIDATSGRARLVNVASLHSLPEFVALSYCWGLTGNLQTLKAPLSRMKESIPTDALPLTIKQTFEIVEALGFRYLWVDALCIVQDDDVDWRREARKMGAIYSNASLVIAAMASKSTEEGLHTRAHDSSPSDDMFHTVMRACRTMPRKQWEEFIQKELPLLCRGWGFQERLLARRIVHFTPAELVWECKGNISCQCGKMTNFMGSGRTMNNMNAAFWLTVDHPSQERVRPMWRECVKTFSRRSLTVPSDRAFAITGVAELLRGSSCADLYISGLWKDALPYDLLWRCDQSTTLCGRKYRKPSWSWVSVDCGINWPTARDTGALSISTESYFESGLEDVDCTHVDTTKTIGDYNPISAGQIHLTTRMIEVMIIHQANVDDEMSPFRTEWSIEGQCGRTLPFYPDIQLSDEDRGVSVDGKEDNTHDRVFYYLEIVAATAKSAGWQAGLIVRKHKAGDEDEIYERIGVAAEMSWLGHSSEAIFVSDVPSRKVVLI